MVKHKVLRRPGVEDKVNVSRSTMYSMIKEGKFPRPIKLGPRSVGWLESEIDAWLEGRIQQRDAEANRGIER